MVLAGLNHLYRETPLDPEEPWRRLYSVVATLWRVPDADVKTQAAQFVQLHQHHYAGGDWRELLLSVRLPLSSLLGGRCDARHSSGR